jgi:hypothetical protein
VLLLLLRLRLVCPRAMSELLTDTAVTDNNIMQFLGVIEQRANEIMQRLAVLSRETAGERVATAGGGVGAAAGAGSGAWLPPWHPPSLGTPPYHTHAFVFTHIAHPEMALRGDLRSACGARDTCPRLFTPSLPPATPSLCCWLLCCGQLLRRLPQGPQALV